MHMARYCKVCGAKSGRCNHLILDFGKRELEQESQKKDGKEE